jgi:Fe(3+) dicitrate transport protein
MCKNFWVGPALVVLTAPAFGEAPEKAEVVATAALADGPQIVVVGKREDLLHIPGSGATIEREDMEAARVLTVNEALRQVPGLYPRDEEGLGLRPNIGVRGLSPTRSGKVLLLEDGLPLTYAPYGDNATYSHPPIRRFERIEVLKGASQIRFGPNTVGGVINYITPDAPSEFEGRLSLAGGDRGYREVDGMLGGEVLGFRLLGHANATGFDGVRANHDLAFSDVFLKAERDLGEGHEVSLRLARMREDSQVSYSGLTQAEFDADPFANPFPNDRFVLERVTAAASHEWKPVDALDVTTSVYSLWFDRDWWRQSSNSGQRPNDASDPLCGGMANLNTTCGNEGRLREYNQYGVESRLAWRGEALGATANLEAGLRWHSERQARLQVNSDTPNGRTPGRSVNGGILENGLRYAEASSGFVAARLGYGRLELSPGVRVEHVAYERVNRLTGARTQTDLSEVIPGLGATFDLRPDLVVYAGVHRGFAPPRVEDVLSAAGGVVDLDPERSLNAELGLRGAILPGLETDLALFRMDFENQIIPASVAGGTGATLTSAGETVHAGAELSLRGSLEGMGLAPAFTARNDLSFRTAVTWLPEAEFAGRRLSGVAGSTAVSVSGNRLPYAPEWIASAALAYERGDWLRLQAEVQHTGEMFTDDLNTVAPSANGQRGRIDGATVWNLALNLTPGDGPATFFVTVKNVLDEVYVVDRARGVLPGAPRLWQAGLALTF